MTDALVPSRADGMIDAGPRDDLRHSSGAAAPEIAATGCRLELDKGWLSSIVRTGTSDVPEPSRLIQTDEPGGNQGLPNGQRQPSAGASPGEAALAAYYRR